MPRQPRKKVTDHDADYGKKKKRASGKRKERDFSSDDEFDDYEQENTKKPGRPAAKSGFQSCLEALIHSLTVLLSLSLYFALHFPRSSSPYLSVIPSLSI